MPFIAELNSLDAELGIGIGSLNVAAGVRWNSAFAYLDPVRGLPNLEILGDSLVDSIILEADRCVGVEVVERGRRTSIFGKRVVLAGGVYGSPLILLRSGIGPATELEAARIACRHDLPGVGRNLQDHPVARLAFAGTDGLNKAMNEFVAAGGDPRQEGTIVLARSGYCHDAFDMHLYPLGTRTVDGWQFAILAAVMTPRSTGAIRVSSRDPESAPQIDHGYFTDDGDNDLSILAEGLELAREIAHRAPLTDLAGTEIAPLVKGTALTEHIRANAITDDHPVGSCKMGPASDPSAVVDERGRVHGIQGLFVGDAAIMPTIPRANTNIPTAVVGEKIAQLLLQN